MSQASATTHSASLPSDPPDVLTLSEAAEYLRLGESDVLRLTAEQALPGRKIGDHWRFLRSGLVGWLLEPSQKARLLRHAGALPYDSDTQSMLKQIYEDRGHQMVEGEL